MKKWIMAGIMLVFILGISGCSIYPQPEGLRDGCYTAQMSEESFGWREYVVITVKNGEIVATEFDAENPSGFIKSCDNAYMNEMKAVSGTYPNEYTRYYAAQLTGQKSVPEIEILAGATGSGNNFQRLAEAAVEQALKGDTTVALVEPLVLEEE